VGKGVAVGGTGVSVGRGVAVGGTGVSVGKGVAVGGSAVGVSTKDGAAKTLCCSFVITANRATIISKNKKRRDRKDIASLLTDNKCVKVDGYSEQYRTIRKLFAHRIRCFRN
jgi:hypothetical protein